MRVLLISQYFPPETGATSNRMISIAHGLRRAGHDVHVIAEKPNHPEGIIRNDYRGSPFEERSYEGIPVTYTWVYTHPEKGFLKRIAFYVSFMVMAVVAAIRKNGPFDIVLASSPPLFVGIAGWLAARLNSAQFVFDVRDTWPEVAVAMGALNNPLAIQVAERLERFIYNRADGLTAVTDSFCNHINEIVEGSPPIRRIMNGTTPEVFDCDEKRDAKRNELGLNGEFTVLYAGNHGLAQGLPHIIESAGILEEKQPVEFVMVGSGPVKDKLMDKAKEFGLSNIQFVNRVPLEEAAAYMAAADALLVPLEDHRIYKQFIPSKLFDSMAAGKPVLLSVDGEARGILDDAKSGLYYPAENSKELAQQIAWLIDHQEKAEEMGQRGRAYARQYCTRSSQVDKLTDFLEELAATV